MYLFISEETTPSETCWWPPRTKTITQKSGLIYQFKFTQAGCDEEYILESGRTFADRLKDHLEAPSPIYQHCHATGLCIRVDSFSITDTEGHMVARTIKEAMFIRFNDPILNRNLGKYQLPLIWDEVLKDTPALHIW